MAIVWYVTLNTGKGAWIAAFTVMSYLPQFLISFLGGVWADRYNKKALIIGADSGIAVITLAMWFVLPYIDENSLMLPLLLAMSALRSVGAGIQTPAVNAVLPQLVPEEDVMRYNGIAVEK
jgi:DHA3 family macrolide efflux protein-like MFS transporter